MRVLARYGRYAVGVRQRIVEAYATGHSRVLQSDLTAYFKPGMLRPEEREIAIHSWVFNGFYQEQDEVTRVEPDYRIGVFDSIQAQAEHGWSDEDRLLVEEELVRRSISDPTTLIVMAEEKLVAPWPNYDVFTGSLNDLCGKILEDGYPLEDVLAYEAENQDRPEVIAALNQLLADADAEPNKVEEILGVSERWRQPVVPLKIDELHQGLWLPDGRVQGEVQLTLSAEDIDRMRQGYVCAKCLEPHERPWPERCQACGAPIRTEQAAYFVREFGGIAPASTRPGWEEELDGLEERRRKEEERAHQDGQLRR